MSRSRAILPVPHGTIAILRGSVSAALSSRLRQTSNSGALWFQIKTSQIPLPTMARRRRTNPQRPEPGPGTSSRHAAILAAQAKQTSCSPWRGLDTLLPTRKRLAGVISLAAVIGGPHPHPLETLVDAADPRNSSRTAGAMARLDRRYLARRHRPSRSGIRCDLRRAP